MHNNTKNKYIPLGELEVYQLARELSKIAWEIYRALDWQTKNTTGNQFLESTDSIGANIAEGYGRFHYLDQIKFYYNSRGSLIESCGHWLELLFERNKVTQTHYKKMKEIAIRLHPKLNNFINSTYRAKDNKFRSPKAN